MTIVNPAGRHALLLFLLAVLACRGPDYFPLNDGQVWRFAGVAEVAAGQAECESLAYAVSVTGAAAAAGLGRVHRVLVTRNDEPYVTLFLRKTRAALFVLPASHLDGLEPTSGWIKVLELPLRAGAAWHGDAERSVLFEVLGCEDVAVPAGQFRDCVRIRMRAAPYAMDLWLAPGEGIVQWHRRFSSSRRELSQRIGR